MNSALLLTLALSGEFFVGAERADALIHEGAVVLDARGDRAAPPFLPRARIIEWTELRDGVGRTGKLDDDLEDLAEELSVLGLRDLHRGVLVYGSGVEGFGEEGRIAWMLAYLGYTKVRVLDGGMRAWTEAKKPIAQRTLDDAPQTKLVFRVRPELRSDIGEVTRALKEPGATVLDVRTLEEWNGATPYHEARGGHIPGAKHLDFRELHSANGRLLSTDQIVAKLRALGADPSRPLIAYCTGGVRSAYVVLALHDAGFRLAENYDGSWYEWSTKNAR